MTSERRNRGMHPGDDKNFSSQWQEILYFAVEDMSYLISRGYNERPALEMVGNQYKLNSRQRKALARMSVADEKVILRRAKKRSAPELVGKCIEIDGFNSLILLESCLSGAYIFKCRDGVYRDISGVHGSYKRVIQTGQAMKLMRAVHQKLAISQCNWYLDKPVSNSGRLMQQLAEFSTQNDLDWKIRITPNPDKDLSASEQIVISSDGLILDNCRHWFNLMDYLIANELVQAKVVNSSWSLI